MGKLAKYVKAVTERKRYQIDYADWLETGEGVTGVVFSVLTVTSPPLVVDNVQVLPTGLGVQYYISGGVDGTTYEVDATMTTNASPAPQVRLDEILVTVREP
jgi:hypothetical protein